VVGVVANMNRPVKRVDLFSESCRPGGQGDRRCEVLDSGDGHLRNELELLSAQLGLESRVIFWGRRDDVQDILKDIAIGVICSDSEGLSNSIMEYMAAGLPVVATDVGGNPELVRMVRRVSWLGRMTRTP